MRQLGIEPAWVWAFPSPERTAARLTAAGFVGVQTWLHDEPSPFDSREELERFLETSVLCGHLADLPAGERPSLVRAVADRLPGLLLDYVRLNVIARRAPGTSGAPVSSDTA